MCVCVCVCVCERPLPSVPAVVLYHVGQLNDELALFVLLTALESVLLERETERERERERETDTNGD